MSSRCGKTSRAGQSIVQPPSPPGAEPTLRTCGSTAQNTPNNPPRTQGRATAPKPVVKDRPAAKKQ
ncbi:hypothetical protein V5O48_018381, partial [Marasmius crinis-equi]